MDLELISSLPRSQAHPHPLLFVHGAWHGAWCWAEHFLEYFADHGYAAYALSLRGHGKSPGHDRLRWTRLSEYVADVALIAERLPDSPILIGHSMGGAVVQHYLATRPGPAGVLLASIPPAGALGATLRVARRHPIQFAKVNLRLSLYPLVATPQLTREAFFSASMPEQIVQKYFARIQDEAYLGFLDMLVPHPRRPGRVKAPMLVMGAANDTLFSTAEIHATARAYNTQAVIFPNMAHDMMLEADWQGVADHIIEWLAAQGL